MADTPQNDEVQNAPTASETGRIDYSHPNYSQKEIDDRLAYFYARIDEDRYIKHLSDRGESLKNLLKEMSLYGVGQRTLMQAPSDMNFEVDTEGYLKTIQAGGIYFSDRNTIRMPLDAKSEANMVCLAHEMRHAIQYKDEAMQRGAISPNPTGRFVQEKMCELETILQDVVLGAQILQRRREGGKNQYCVSGEVKNAAYFYCDEVERYQERGLSLAEAERMARTSVAQIYWTGLRELPEGLSQDDISPFLKGDVNRWNQVYNLQSLRVYAQENADAEDIKQLLRPQKRDFQEKSTKEDLLACINGQNRNNLLIPKYVERMDIALPEEWFLEKQYEKSNVGDYYICEFYPDENQKTALISFVDKDGERLFVAREFDEPSKENGKQNINHEITYDSRRRPHGLEITNTQYNRTITPWKRGVKEGIVERVAGNNTTLTEFEYNKKNGWETSITSTPTMDYMATTFYKNDKKEGLETIIDDGVVFTTNYEKDKKNGVAKKTDTITGYECSTEYKDDKKHGLQEESWRGKVFRRLVWEEGKLLKVQYLYEGKEAKDPHKDFYERCYGLKDTDETVESLLARIREPKDGASNTGVAPKVQEPGWAVTRDFSKSINNTVGKPTPTYDPQPNMRPKDSQNG